MHHKCKSSWCIIYIHRVWSAVVLSLLRTGLVLHKSMHIWCIYEACTSPTLNGSSVLQHVELIDALEYGRRNKIWFLSLIVTYICNGLCSLDPGPPLLPVFAYCKSQKLEVEMIWEQSYVHKKITQSSKCSQTSSWTVLLHKLYSQTNRCSSTCTVKCRWLWHNSWMSTTVH